MATFVDARLNEYQGALDQINNGTFTDARTSTSTLNSLNATVVMDLNGKATAMYHINVTVALASSTLVVEGTMDGVNFFTVPVFVLASATTALSVGSIQPNTGTAMTVGQHAFSAECAGWRQIRIRMSAYSSGSATIACRASLSDLIVITKPVPATQCTSVQGTAAASATLTLATPPTGLVTYLVSLRIGRTSTALLAGTATLSITTTNLNSLAWTVGNLVNAGETRTDIVHEPSVPIRCPGGAGVVSMPAPGAAVLWTAQAVYYFDV